MTDINTLFIATVFLIMSIFYFWGTSPRQYKKKEKKKA